MVVAHYNKMCGSFGWVLSFHYLLVMALVLQLKKLYVRGASKKSTRVATTTVKSTISTANSDETEKE